MKKRNLLTVLPLMALMLSGCDGSDELKNFESARSSVLQSPDPFSQMKAFHQRITGFGHDCDGFDLAGYFARKSPCELRKEADLEIVKKSVDAGSVPALVSVFDNAEKAGDVAVVPDDFGDSANAMAQRLVALAQAAPATRDNVPLLHRGAALLQSGTYVMRNSQQAAALYLKAWQAGDRGAGEELAAIYRYLQDYRRAYFWETRSLSHSDDSSTKLSGAEIAEIQHQAADSSRTNL
ncbi:hypothetical protein DH20_14225 [Pantoea agglomerans]|nr:hypothetical protein [Pantoea agglomerans]